jgi:cbb3-type cytochrome oxidase subunit 3
MVETDTGFLFATAAVNMSLASLAGLVIAFRRTGIWAAHDLFRLRQIVEWGFANVLLALLVFPLSSWLASEMSALRAVGAVALLYIAVNLLALERRRRGTRDLIRVTPLIVGVDVALVMLATATIILATMTAWELTLLALIARPMLAFLFVLATLGREGGAV